MQISRAWQDPIFSRRGVIACNISALPEKGLALGSGSQAWLERYVEYSIYAGTDIYGGPIDRAMC